jgi:hypothetical protein
MIEAKFMERLLGTAGSERQLAALAKDVAARKKDPFAAVDEILKQSKLFQAGHS